MIETKIEQEAFVAREANEYLRLYDDATTELAEMLDGPMHTPFEFYYDGNTLRGRDGRSLDDITTKSLKEADTIAQANPLLSFEPRRRRHERQESIEANAMANGDLPNTMIVITDFPPELMNSSVSVGGYNAARKQAYVRVWANDSTGKLMMYSQSLDLSNREGLESIYDYFDETPEEGELLGQRIHREMSEEEQKVLVTRLTGIYDRKMAAMFGGIWHAGRRGEKATNTYDFVCSQQDLIEAYMDAEKLPVGSKNKLKYDIAAAMDRRFKNGLPNTYKTSSKSLIREINYAGSQARAINMIFIACGIALSTENAIREAGMGGATGEDKYGPLSFTCKKGHSNIRPYGSLISNCQHCGDSVKC